MPYEHLEKPARPEDWQLYRAASKAALDEGEAAERWSREGRGGFEAFANSGQSGNSSNSSATSEFDGWHRQALAAGAETYRLADTERANFDRIARAEAQENRLPVVNDIGLAELSNGMAIRPQSLDADVLEARRGLARPPLEVMLDTLLQHGIAPDAQGFREVLDDARLRVARDAGDLTSVLQGFMKATHAAVAASVKEPVPSPTWTNGEGTRHFREAGERLADALRSWETLIRAWDSPPKEEILSKGQACSDALRRMALECAPGSILTDNVAFSAVTGLAMLMALGERLSAQIQSRFGEVTIQGLYNRILEIPNRAPPDNLPGVAQRGKERFRELASFWRDEFHGAAEPLRNTGVNKVYFDTIFSPNVQNPIRQALALFDATMNQADNLDTPAALSSMKKAVEKLGMDLSYLRRFIDQQAGLVGPDAHNYVEFRGSREHMLETIDTIAREMQVRLGSALKVGL